MPRLFGVAVALTVVTVVTGGCAASREPVAVIQPEFSYVRHGDGRAIDAAAVGTLDPLAGELLLDENGLLVPATRSGQRLVATDRLTDTP